MVQIQEASLEELAIHMLAAAARDHGRAVFVMRGSTEDLLVAHFIVSRSLAIELVALADADAERLAAYVARTCGCDRAAIRIAATLEDALFARHAWITSRRGAHPGALPPYEYNPEREVLKFNPLAEWSESHVRIVAAREKLAALSPDGAERLAA